MTADQRIRLGVIGDLISTYANAYPWATEDNKSFLDAKIKELIEELRGIEV